jgi:hypothetical protein
MSSWLAELVNLGWLERVESGTTPQFRPMALRGALEGNRAAVYQLRIPVPAEQSNLVLTRTPTVPQRSLISRSTVVLTRASQNFHKLSTVPPVNTQNDGPNGPRLDREEPRWFDLRVPVSPGQMLAAAGELRSDDYALSRLSARAVRALMKPWWRAGWTNRDLLRALRRVPTVGGTRVADRCPASELRHPAGWARHRLRAWLNASTGTPGLPPAQWDDVLETVGRAHGRGAAARLPYGLTRLSPAHLSASEADRSAAGLMLARRRAGELADERSALRPTELIASPAIRVAQLEDIRKALAAGRPRIAGDTSGTTTGADGHVQRAADRPTLPPRNSDETWRRAVEKARMERSEPKRRRRR